MRSHRSSKSDESDSLDETSDFYAVTNESETFERGERNELLRGSYMSQSYNNGQLQFVGYGLALEQRTSLDGKRARRNKAEGGGADQSELVKTKKAVRGGLEPFNSGPLISSTFKVSA